MRRSTVLLSVVFPLVAGILFFLPGQPKAPSQDPEVLPGLEPKRLVVMNLAAHPDDEDGQTLAHYRWGQNAAAYSIIYTRGEGGQNEIGPELYDELGALRTEETERAARILGTQVFFLNYEDFGYSRFAKEAFEKWGGRDSVTARIVYLVRKLKPDVMFTNHDTVTVGPRQHGQHQAVGISAYDAFSLAADPGYHPEQLEEAGVDLWQPSRLFLRYWREPDGYDVAVPVGDTYEPLQQSYSEIASNALREHASQGMGMFTGRASRPQTFFKLLRSATDIPPTETDLAGGLPPKDRYPSLSYYIDAGLIPTVPASSIQVDDDVVVPGQELSFDIGLTTGESATFWYDGAPMDAESASLVIPKDVVTTYPKVTGQYNRFQSTYPICFAVFSENRIVRAGYLPVEVAPVLDLETSESHILLRNGTARFGILARVYDPTVEAVEIDWKIVDGHTVLANGTSRPLANDDGDYASEIFATVPDNLPEGDYSLVVSGSLDSRISGAIKVEKRVPARSVNAVVPADLAVGIIRSYDDAMEQAMQTLGVRYRMLDSLDLATGNYADLNTIVVDIRAYLVRQDLRMYNANLLNWVSNGGHLVVNYQKTFEWNEGGNDPFEAGKQNPGDFAPYKLRLGRERVTFEDAPVKLLQPNSPLLHYPNAIESKDWDGWIQERGLYFPSDYDEKFEELFEMNDPGESPARSSTLLAPFGKGTYMYTAIVWYRQLKVYHPGAYRMFANILSLPKVDA